jgi:photosystem II stability/assembly factor-like uncharacterized protein
MRFIIIFIISSLYFVASSQQWTHMITDPQVSFYETQKAFNEELARVGQENMKGFKQFKRWEHFMETRIDSNGFFTHQDAANRVYKELLNTNTAKGAKGAGYWTQLGPFGPSTNAGSGRVNCIAYHPTNSNIILIGSASGGLWRSVNGGQSWTSNTDGLENLGYSDINFCEANPNIVYAATGDKNGGDTYSVGLLKSFDGGLTWQTTGLTYTPNAKRKIYRVLVHPQNDSIVYVASSLGFRKSTDGGQTWVQKRAGSFVDAVFKPNDPNTIYAATNSVVIKSTDAGQSWSLLSIPFVSSNRRLVLGVTPANADYLYVLSARSSDNGFGGVYRSIDAGANFTLRSSTPNLLGWSPSGNDSGGQGWYDLAIGVSRTNPNLVFVGGINIWVSGNGGSSWAFNAHWTGQAQDYVHADIHEIEFSPHNSTELWACTDGGVSVSINNGADWDESNTNLSIAQMYRMGGSATNANKVLTGWQDNGTNIYSNSSWYKELGGDGMECIIDYSNNNYMYGSLYYGAIRRSTNGGNDWISITDDINENGAWVTPYIQDPNIPATIYAGYYNIYKSSNRGNSWSKISNFSSSNTIRALALAPSNSNVIYAANLYTLYTTQNGGSSWTNITHGGFGTNGITYIAVHPTNPNRIWVTVGGYSNGNKVFYSSDAGQNWQNISGTLPNLPANTIVCEKNSPDGVYLGMDVGVYYIDSTMTDWKPFMQNLPNVIVSELEIFYPDNKIRAATYGRGLWESPLHHLVNGLNKGEQTTDKNAGIEIFPNPTNGLVQISHRYNEFSDARVRIFSTSGRLLIEKIISNTQQFKIDLSKFEKGVYIIQITDNKLTTTRRLLLK